MHFYQRKLANGVDSGLRNRARGLGLGGPGLQHVYLPHPDDLGEPRPSPRAPFGSDLTQMHNITTLNQSLCYNV